MSWRVFLIAAAAMLAPCSAAASVSSDVREKCAATAFDGATCDRLARVAEELVTSENVSDQLAEEIGALPVAQREWLEGALDDLADAAAAPVERGGDDTGVTEPDFDASTSTSHDAHSGRGSSALQRALQKASDYIRRTLR